MNAKTSSEREKLTFLPLETCDTLSETVCRAEMRLFALAGSTFISGFDSVVLVLMIARLPTT